MHILKSVAGTRRNLAWMFTKHCGIYAKVVLSVTLKWCYSMHFGNPRLVIFWLERTCSISHYCIQTDEPWLKYPWTFKAQQDQFRWRRVGTNLWCSLVAVCRNCNSSYVIFLCSTTAACLANFEHRSSYSGQGSSYCEFRWHCDFPFSWSRYDSFGKPPPSAAGIFWRVLE